MQKWDMLLIETRGGGASLYASNPEELTDFANDVVGEGLKYFSYVAQPKYRYEIRVVRKSTKGHQIEIYYQYFTKAWDTVDVE